MRAPVAAFLASLLAAFALAGPTNGQEANVRITFLGCDTNPEVVFIENLGDVSQDLTGWLLRSDPADDFQQRFDLSVIGSLGPGERVRIFSGGAAPSSDAASGRYLWSPKFKYRDDDPKDFAQIVDGGSSLVDQLNCGQEPTLPERGPPPTQEEPEANCDPSYPDVCIPVGSEDYDCAGGTGDGPNYVEGPIRVRPPDPHELDPDGDGIACETTPTSEVAGAVQAPASPVAGFGPIGSDGASPFYLVIAGLAGAGIAWLIAGLAGVGVATVVGNRTPRPRSAEELYEAATDARSPAAETPVEGRDGVNSKEGRALYWLIDARAELAAADPVVVPGLGASRRSRRS